MTKRRLIVIAAGFLVAMAIYATWCLRPFFLSARLDFDIDVPEEARKAIDGWYRENRDFGRVTPSVRGAIHFLGSPWEDSMPAGKVAYYDWKGGGKEVKVYFRGNSQGFNLFEGTWKPEDFAMRDPMNYIHPSNPNHGFSWWDVVWWEIESWYQ